VGVIEELNERISRCAGMDDSQQLLGIELGLLRSIIYALNNQEQRIESLEQGSVVRSPPLPSVPPLRTGVVEAVVSDHSCPTGCLTFRLTTRDSAAPDFFRCELKRAFFEEVSELLGGPHYTGDTMVDVYSVATGVWSISLNKDGHHVDFLYDPLSLKTWALVSWVENGVRHGIT